MTPTPADSQQHLQHPHRATATTNHRTIYYDVLNVFACVAVVFIHANGIVHNYPTGDAYYHDAWAQALIVEVLAYVAVPIFLMLTGATLMKYRDRYDTKTFFKKRLTRVLVPFFLWMLINFALGVRSGWYDLSAMSPQQVINAFMFSEMMRVYWFFPVVIAIYFAIPILSLLSAPQNNKYLWYIAISGMITCSVLPLVCNIIGVNFNSAYSMPLTGGGFIIYPILGHLLSTIEVKKKWRIGLYLAAIFCFVSRYLFVYFASAQTGELDKTVSGYFFINTIIPAAAIFIFAKQIQWSKFFIGGGRAAKTLATVSSCSLGIYLIHMLVMEKLVVYLGPSSRLLWRTTGALLVYLACLGIVAAVKKIPYLRNIFP